MYDKYKIKQSVDYNSYEFTIYFKLKHIFTVHIVDNINKYNLQWYFIYSAVKDLEASLNVTGPSNTDDSTLQINIAKFADDGGVYGAPFLSDKPLYVAVTEYNGYPSPLFGIQERMNAYCANRCKTMGAGEFSENFTAIQENYACRFSYVDKKTREQYPGMTAYASGFHISGDATNIGDWLVLFNDFLHYVCQEDPENKGKFSQTPLLNVMTPTGLSLNLEQHGTDILSIGSLFC